MAAIWRHTYTRDDCVNWARAHALHCHVYKLLFNRPIARSRTMKRLDRSPALLQFIFCLFLKTIYRSFWLFWDNTCKKKCCTCVLCIWFNISCSFIVKKTQFNRYPRSTSTAFLYSMYTQVELCYVHQL